MSALTTTDDGNAISEQESFLISRRFVGLTLEFRSAEAVR